MLALFQDFVTRIVGDHGLVAIFLLMLLGSACIPIPSEVVMLFGGALASTGFAGAGHELTLPNVVLWGMLGTLAGSWLAYWVGLVGGRPWSTGAGDTSCCGPTRSTVRTVGSSGTARR